MYRLSSYSYLSLYHRGVKSAIKRKIVSGKKNITYYSDGEGNWTKTIWQKQCSKTDLFRHKCQGVKGHKGNHWQYKPDGSYHYWKNKKDPKAIKKGTAMGTIPPGHDSYIEPIKKSMEYYMKFHESEKVTNSAIISELEKNNPPEKEAMIDRPLLKEEQKDFKKSLRH